MNRLHNALSPYLLQHADNPVHWQPWDAAAFAQARRENKPILLSIGYAACHWCHVMAHESFADADTAALMNACFVNIKVDREERPDIDRIYQSAHFIFTRRAGGWPLTMFLTPAGEPFFGGTYFPKTARAGLPAFTHIMERVQTVWTERQADVQAQNAAVLAALRALDTYPLAGGALSETPLHSAAEQFEQLFDDDNGGLGGAPKFPHPAELEFCLHYAQTYNRDSLLARTRHSLRVMADSGLHDHLGGGFFRYCTDAQWMIPHFEKMLYDNGLLLALYAEAGAALNDQRLRQAAAATATWALNTMRDADGLFYASLDADSAGGEGAFYLWDDEELRQVLGDDGYRLAQTHYRLGQDAPRVEGQLHLVRCAADGAAADDSPLAAVHEPLLQRRRQRLPPPTDDKILTAWNALMCRGLALSGRLQQNTDWLQAAQRGLTALCERMRVNGRTMAVRRGDRQGEYGFLDDVAFLLEAILAWLRADFSAQWLATAGDLARELHDYYYDEADGGFFFTASDGEVLIRRLKVTDDHAMPSGNGIACRALLQLAQLSGDMRWHAMAEKTLLRFKAIIQQQPSAHASLAAALQYYLMPPVIIYLTGDAALCRQWQLALEAKADPARLVFCLPAVTDGLPPPLQKAAPASGAAAYVCDERGCSMPLTELAAIEGMLEK